MIFDVICNGRNQFVNIFERTAPDAFAGYFAEEAFDHVKPGTGCWNKMQMESGMAFEPCLHASMFVRPVIVDNKMQVQIRWSLDIDQLQEPDKLLVSVPRHAIAYNFAVEHAQGGK